MAASSCIHHGPDLSGPPSRKLPPLLEVRMPRLKDFKKLSESRVPVGGACALSPAPGPFSAEAARKQSQQQQREETDSIWLNFLHLGTLLPPMRDKKKVSQWELYFQQNHSSQLQIDALKPSKRDAPRDTADANLGKARGTKHLDWKQSASPKADIFSHKPLTMGPPCLTHCICCNSLDNGLCSLGADS